MEEILYKQIQIIIKQRKLSPIMNETKWQQLIEAVDSLVFPPPYIRKDLFSKSPKLSDFSQDVYSVGDWHEGVYPLLTVEWIKVRPRFLRTIGTVPKLVDGGQSFESILRKCQIPFIQYDNAYIIYGYIGPDNNLLDISV